jgi:putative Mn2+ efflux pump MntP
VGIAEVFLIALGLSMDAFAVSITLGLSVKRPSVKEIVLPGLYFGFFQALMPAIGFLAGSFFAQAIQGVDHWIAFALLGFIGGKMIKDSLAKESGHEKGGGYSFQGPKMLVLALATSIDALAAGLTFAFLEVPLFRAILITGAVTCIVSMGGVITGGFFGAKLKSQAEFAGGAVLILLGVKIVIEHVLW